MFKKTVTFKTDRVQTGKAEQNETAKIIEALRNNDSRVIGKVYEQQFFKIRNMVKSFRYLDLDPHDVFQEGMTRAVMNVRQDKFKGDSSFATYLYSICRNICLKEYQKSKGTLPLEFEDLADDVAEDYFELLQIINREKGKLGEDCQRIINLRFGLTR